MPPSLSMSFHKACPRGGIQKLRGQTRGCCLMEFPVYLISPICQNGSPGREGKKVHNLDNVVFERPIPKMFDLNWQIKVQTYI